MGRKKKKSLKPWCWYCNREFDDEKVLIGHQKAKHFRCHICHKKLYTAPGLAIHCSQVHKETISKVPNAMPERETLDLEIYGMEGVPDEAKHAREITKYGRLTEETTLEAKRPKLDTSAGGFPGMMPGFPPGIMPGMPPMLHPGMGPPHQVGMSLPPQHMMGMQQPMSSHPGMLSPPQKPLFPSAANQQPASNQMQPPSHINPLPPPFNNITPIDSTVPDLLKNAPLINPLPENSKLMHPVQDLSMEEIRAVRSQYKGTNPHSSLSAPPQSIPGQFSAQPMYRPGMPPMTGPIPGNIIRPGMAPMHHPGMRPPMGHIQQLV